MLEFLKKANITDETIKCISNNISSNDIKALVDNEEECLKTIDLLTKMGIKPINELLIYETYIFTKLSGRVYDELTKYNVSELVKNVNEDYTVIEKYV